MTRTEIVRSYARILLFAILIQSEVCFFWGTLRSTEDRISSARKLLDRTSSIVNSRIINSIWMIIQMDELLLTFLKNNSIFLPTAKHWFDHFLHLRRSAGRSDYCHAWDYWKELHTVSFGHHRLSTDELHSSEWTFWSPDISSAWLTQLKRRAIERLKIFSLAFEIICQQENHFVLSLLLF